MAPDSVQPMAFRPYDWSQNYYQGYEADVVPVVNQPVIRDIYGQPIDFDGSILNYQDQYDMGGQYNYTHHPYDWYAQDNDVTQRMEEQEHRKKPNDLLNNLGFSDEDDMSDQGKLNPYIREEMDYLKQQRELRDKI